MNENSQLSFGRRLRNAREMRGLTLESIAAATKIGTKSLRALEEDDFHKLPGGIFNKGFVRAYCRFIGIDEERAVADYLEAAQISRGLVALQAADTFHADVLIVPKKRSKDYQPPKAAKFLLLLIPEKNREFMDADLEERYRTILVPEFGVRKAKFWYWWHVLISVAPPLWDALKRVLTATFLWKLTR